MSPYRQAIAIFGFAIPIIIAAAVIIAALAIRANITGSFQEKIGQYKGFEQKRVGAMKLEAEISRKRPDIARWEGLIEGETASTLSSHLREIEEKLPSKEFQKTAQEHSNNGGGFSSAVGQASSEVRLSFRATFRAMQTALLELETRMPQLQLQDLRIDPSASSNSLNFQVTYTAWEK